MSGTIRDTRFWSRHDSTKDRRHMNKEFRVQEHQYFRKIGEFLIFPSHLF